MKLSKISSLICAAAMLFCSIGGLPVSAAEKETVNRTISIVYDNSGSMFLNGGKNMWCQAQYAIEIFASMMNEGDKLLVYPMCHVTVEGEGGDYFYDGSPLVIASDADRKKIRNIKTDFSRTDDSGMHLDNTPLESVDAAHAGLSGAGGEKWLIVLTDGDKFYSGKTELNPGKTKEALEERFARYIADENIIYLGIGTGLSKPQPGTASENVYLAETADSARVPTVLTEMCNLIFGRDVLPSKYYTENSVQFDADLSGLYLFIQGEDIGNVSLSKDGNAMPYLRSFEPKYGTAGCMSGDYYTAGYKEFRTDPSLQGFIAVYSDLPAGTYSFSYTGKKSSIAFYYELDADLAVMLFDAYDQPVTDPSQVLPGDYSLVYALVDKHGNVIDSELLGDVNYELTYTLNGEKHTENAHAKSSVKSIHLDETTEFSVDSIEGTYLSGYRVRKSGAQLGFLSIPFRGVKGAAKSLEVLIEGTIGNIDADRVEDCGILYVTFLHDGEPITGEDLDRVEFRSSSSNPSLVCRTERTENGYAVTLGAAQENGVLTPGMYNVDFDAAYSSDTEESSSARGRVSFTVNEVSDRMDVEFRNPETYFTLADIAKEKAEPIRTDISVNGEPVPDEFLRELSFNASADGMALITEPLYGESAYLIRFDPENLPDTGSYAINVTADGVTDRMGREMSAEKTLRVKVALLPGWLATLIGAGIAALLVTAAVLISRIPALPKNIEVYGATIKVGGKTVASGSAKAIYPKHGKTRTLTIVGNGALRNQNFSVRLVPAKGSCLSTPSKKRRAMVRFDSISASANVDEVNISKVASRDRKTRKMECDAKKDFTMPKQFEFSGSRDFDGVSKKFSVSGNIRYK